MSGGFFEKSNVVEDQSVKYRNSNFSRLEPYPDMSNAAAVSAIVNNQASPNSLPSTINLPEEMRQLLAKCWKREPTERVSAVELQRELQALHDKA